MWASPYHVGIQVGIVQAEVGGQVDDPLHLAPKLGHDALRGAVGQAEEAQVEALGRAGLVGGEDQVGIVGGQARVQVGHPGAGLGVARGQLDLQVGMAGAEPQQLGAGEARRPDDTDGDHRTIIRIYA